MQPNPYQATAYPTPHQAGYPQPTAGAGPVALTADGVRLAGWWWRVLASVVDGLLISMVVTGFTLPIYRRMVAQLTSMIQLIAEAQRTGGTPSAPSFGDFMSTQDQLILVSVSLAVGAVYHAVFLRWKAATPGKLMCGLRVVPVDRGQNQEPLAWNSIAIRIAVWLLPTVNGLLGVIRLIDGLFPLWQPKRQTLHDLAAKTQVVRRG